MITNTGTARRPRLERLLAALLQNGTWLASAVIGIGLVVLLVVRSGVVAGAGVPIVAAGIALLILLPVLRVAVMLVAFAVERDYLFSGIAALVLVIILAGLALGMRAERAAAPVGTDRHLSTR
jgi:uncharacterized membrane protein